MPWWVVKSSRFLLFFLRAPLILHADAWVTFRLTYFYQLIVPLNRLYQVFCSMSSFMLGYHVHEKAIMTAMVPMTLLASNTRHMARLYIRTCMFGLFGILPLLFRPQELLFKAALYVGWMCGVAYALESIHRDGTVDGRGRRTVLTAVDIVLSVVLACVLIFMDVIHPLVFVPRGRLEFLPLMITSVVCAVGLAWCWWESCRQMIHGSVRVAWR
jgi:hypothetical protein